MKKKTITLEESGYNIQDGRTMICKIIDNQINEYKLQYLADWERNHHTSSTETDLKIEKLECAKKELLSLFKDCGSGDEEVSFTLSLEVKLTDKHHSKISDNKLIAS